MNKYRWNPILSPEANGIIKNMNNNEKLIYSRLSKIGSIITWIQIVLVYLCICFPFFSSTILPFLVLQILGSVFLFYKQKKFVFSTEWAKQNGYNQKGLTLYRFIKTI